jgi:bacteriocin-like protein
MNNVDFCMTLTDDELKTIEGGGGDDCTAQSDHVTEAIPIR